jgi:hypothetical protein
MRVASGRLAVATARPLESKIMARVLPLPWSMANSNRRDVVIAELSLQRRPPSDTIAALPRRLRRGIDQTA